MDLKRIWQARISKVHLGLSLVLTIAGACALGLFALILLDANELGIDFTPWTAVLMLFICYIIVALFLLHAIRRDALGDPGAAKSNVIALGVISLPFLLLIGLYGSVGIRNILEPPPEDQVRERLQYLVEHQAEFQDSSNLVNGVLAAFGADTLWRPFASNDSTFQVDLPNIDPVVSISEVPVGARWLVFHEVSVNTSNSLNQNLKYSVASCRLGWIRTTGQMDSLFEAQRDYLLATAPAKLIEHSTLDMINTPGREMTMRLLKTDAPEMMRCRMFFHHGMFFRLIVISSKDRMPNKAMEHFLTSFRIRK